MAFRAPGGLQRRSYQMKTGDSERAGLDLHPLCIHLHKTKFCGDHTPHSSFCGGGEGGLLQVLSFGEEEGGQPEEDRAPAQGCRGGVQDWLS